MKQIDVFVETAYRHVQGDKKEIYETKEEMKNHLIEAVQELKLEGKSEEEAIQIAIERFGGEKEMRAVVGQLFQAQKLFAKWVLFLGLGFLIVSLSFFGFIWQNDEKTANELSIVATDAANILHNQSTLTPTVKTKIKNLINNSSNIAAVRVYHSGEIRSKGKDFVMYDTNVKDADFTYERTLSAPTWLGGNFYPYGNGDEQWYVEMEYRSFSTLETVALIAGIAVYWTLFAIWGTVNAYHHRRLCAGWILVFILFNIVGYAFYILAGKKNKEKPIHLT